MMETTKTWSEVLAALDENDRIAVFDFMQKREVPPHSKKADTCIALLQKEYARIDARIDAETKRCERSKQKRAVKDRENLRFLLRSATGGLRMPDTDGEHWTVHITFTGEDADTLSRLLFQNLGYIRNEDFSSSTWIGRVEP